MMIPLAVGVVFVKFVHREALTDYGLGLRAGLGGWRLWVLAALGPALVHTVPLVLLSIVVFDNPLHPRFTWAKFAQVLGIIPVTILVSTFTNSLGEEFGWRGHLLRRLRRTLGWRASTLVIGPVWALYHLPIVLMAGTGANPGRSP